MLWTVTGAFLETRGLIIPEDEDFALWPILISEILPEFGELLHH